MRLAPYALLLWGFAILGFAIPAEAKPKAWINSQLPQNLGGCFVHENFENCEQAYLQLYYTRTGANAQDPSDAAEVEAFSFEHCAGGNDQACTAYAQILETQGRSAEAIAVNQELARRGLPHRLAILYFNSKHPYLAAAFAHRECRGNFASCPFWMRYFVEDVRYQEFVGLSHLACLTSYKDAVSGPSDCLLLAVYYWRNGNPKMALRFFDMTCGFGNEDACLMRAELSHTLAEALPALDTLCRGRGRYPYNAASRELIEGSCLSYRQQASVDPRFLKMTSAILASFQREQRVYRSNAPNPDYESPDQEIRIRARLRERVEHCTVEENFRSCKQAFFAFDADKSWPPSEAHAIEIFIDQHCADGDAEACSALADIRKSKREL